jgi:hypothetical protein
MTQLPRRQFTRNAAARRLGGFALAAAIALAATPDAGAGAGQPRAEVQIGLCDDPATLVQALQLKPRAKPYETWLFDDPSLALFDRGVRIRLRVQPHQSELTIKIANQDCAKLPKGTVPRRDGKCEYDVHGEAAAGAVSLTRWIDASVSAELVAGKRTLADELNPAQVRYLRDVVRVYPLPVGVRALGPILNRVYRTSEGGYDVDVAELPGGERYAEISTKVPLAQAGQAEHALVDHLARAGVAPCADQSAQAANKLRLLLRR